MKHPRLNKLIQTRKEKKLTSQEMAKLVGISQSMYSYLETGTKRLSYPLAVKIADVLETTPDTLFAEDYEQFFKENDI